MGCYESGGVSNDCEGENCRGEKGQCDTHDRVCWRRWRRGRGRRAHWARVPRQDMLFHVSCDLWEKFYLPRIPFPPHFSHPPTPHQSSHMNSTLPCLSFFFLFGFLLNLPWLNINQPIEPSHSSTTPSNFHLIFEDILILSINSPKYLFWISFWSCIYYLCHIFVKRLFLAFFILYNRLFYTDDYVNATYSIM